MKKDMIFEEWVKKQNAIMEYTIIGNSAAEEADDQTQDAGGADAGADPMAGGMGGADPMAGGADPMAGGMGGADPMAGGADPMAGGADTGADADGGAQAPEGFAPQDAGAGAGDPMMDAGMDPMAGGADPMGGAAPENGDDVVDISDLTDTQDDIKDEIKHQDKRIDKALEDIGSFKEIVHNSNEKLDAIINMYQELKTEFEKRNPTQVEKLGLQTTKSYPFSETVPEFWAKKEKESNYSTEPDNNGKDMGQYVITNDDVNGDTNWKGIADSLDDDDVLFGLTLDKLTRF